MKKSEVFTVWKLCVSAWKTRELGKINNCSPCLRDKTLNCPESRGFSIYTLFSMLYCFLFIRSCFKEDLQQWTLNSYLSFTFKKCFIADTIHLFCVLGFKNTLIPYPTPYLKIISSLCGIFNLNRWLNFFLFFCKTAFAKNFVPEISFSLKRRMFLRGHFIFSPKEKF